MDIYDLDLKRVTNQGPDVLISTGITDRSVLPAALTNAPTRTYFGMEPGESDVFKKYFTVKKVAHITVPAGGTHKHTTKVAVNRWVS